jgi:hypothetical protein
VSGVNVIDMTTTTSLTKITTASGTPIPSAIIKSDCLGRIHVSKEHRVKLLDAFDSSGMSGVKFAEHYGIKYTTFASWIQKRRRERNENHEASHKSANRLLDSLAEVTLIEPTLVTAAASASLVTLKLPGGSSLDIGNPEQARIAAALLRNLNDQSHA